MHLRGLPRWAAGRWSHPLFWCWLADAQAQTCKTVEALSDCLPPGAGEMDLRRAHSPVGPNLSVVHCWTEHLLSNARRSCNPPKIVPRCDHGIMHLRCCSLAQAEPSTLHPDASQAEHPPSPAPGFAENLA